MTQPGAELDRIARELARPIPRRRALGLLGSGIVAASVPAWMRPRRAHACTCAQVGNTCSDGGTPCQVDQPPNATNCPGCRVANNCACPGGPGEEDLQCCPPYEQAGGRYTWCCHKAERCGAPNECICEGGVCGSKCCPAGEECKDPDKNLCCKPKATACETGDRCCGGEGRISETTCCVKRQGGRPVSSTCCGPEQTCDRGECKCDDKDTEKCGEECCPKGRTCCKGSCCKPGVDCCGGRCCSSRRDTCTTELFGGKVCCPPTRTVRPRRGGAVCCPVGLVVGKSGEGCCPADNPFCCGGRGVPEVSCPRGQVCVSGVCESIERRR